VTKGYQIKFTHGKWTDFVGTKETESVA